MSTGAPRRPQVRLAALGRTGDRHGREPGRERRYHRTVVHVTALPGTAGTAVKVTITTVESYFTRSGPSKSTATFSYAP